MAQTAPNGTHTEVELRRAIDRLVDAVQKAKNSKELSELRERLQSKIAELQTLQR
jgi:hypothetical protein